MIYPPTTEQLRAMSTAPCPYWINHTNPPAEPAPQEYAMPPIKPEVCIDGERVAVFLGADYKHMTLDQVEVLIRKLQSAAAIVRRKQRRERLDRCCTMPSTEHAA